MDKNTNIHTSSNSNSNSNNDIHSSHKNTPTPCYYEQQGSNNNSPIVFIHGSYASTSTWKKIVQQLALSHHCISIKLPGHCGMPDPDDFNAPNISTELAIIESVIAELIGKAPQKNQPIHLIGHSFGGVVALALALKGTVNISQLTLFEPVSTWVFESVGDNDMTAQVNAFIQSYRQSISNNTPYVCGQVIDFWAGEGSFEPLPDFIKDGMTALTRNNNRHWTLCDNTHHHRSALNALTIPTKLICGSASNKIAQRIVHHLNHELPNAKQYNIPGASHFLVTSHANQCIDIIND